MEDRNMNSNPLPESELILNSDGSLYHICLREEHISDNVLLVGDQGRVAQISKHFDEITFKIQNREFVTHTGLYKGNLITAISTGIGTDNIDIVVNELHAAVNIDLNSRMHKENPRSLNLIRIGTSGGLQDDITAGTHIVSEYGLGFDGLVYYYKYPFDEKESKLMQEVQEHLEWNPQLSAPYITGGSPSLIEKIGGGMRRGITATATGFYGPQGRSLGLELTNQGMNDTLKSFDSQGLRITNFEMETSALFGLGKLYGHKCCTCCVLLTNRTTKDFIEDHDLAVEGLIETVLDRL